MRQSIPLLLLGLVGCAEGGSKNQPKSDVQLSASHHFWGFVGARAFSAFPLKPNETAIDRGTLVMQTDGQYRVTRNNQPSGLDGYALERSGQLSMLISQGSRLPQIVFAGAYGLEGATGQFYFADRYTTTSSQNIGLFFGTQVIQGAPTVTGNWHVFSHHILFSSSTVLDPNNVGRSFAGQLAIDAAGVVTGTGTESNKAAITLGGKANAFADSRVDLTLDYQDAQTKDTRIYFCGTGRNLTFGLDDDSTDGEIGILALVAHRTNVADLNLLAGTWWVGLHTVFVDPSRPGTDAAHGTLTINATGGFTLNATGAGGIAFSYTGSYTMKDNGALVLTVAGTNETWSGAVDQDYKTLVLGDNFVEQRSGNKPPELNLIVGIRRVVGT